MSLEIRQEGTPLTWRKLPRTSKTYSGTKQMRNSSEINENPNHWLILSSSSRLWAVTVFFDVLLCSCGSRKNATVFLFPELTAWQSWTPSSILNCPLHRLENFNKRDRCVFGWNLQCLYNICFGEENKMSSALCKILLGQRVASKIIIVNLSLANITFQS